MSLRRREGCLWPAACLGLPSLTEPALFSAQGAASPLNILARMLGLLLKTVDGSNIGRGVVLCLSAATMELTTTTFACNTDDWQQWPKWSLLLILYFYSCDPTNMMSFTAVHTRPAPAAKGLFPAPAKCWKIHYLSVAVSQEKLSVSHPMSMLCSPCETNKI